MKVTTTPSIITVLGVIFVVLKLCGVINWSWIWVLSPFWAPFIIVLLFILGMYNMCRR